MADSNFFKKFNIFKAIKIAVICFFILVIVVPLSLYLYSPYEKALIAVNNGNYKKADQIMTISSKIFPFNAKWYSLRGYARYNLENYEGAISDYDIAYNFSDDEYKTMNFDNKIAILYQIKEYDRAINDFDDEIEKAKDEFIKDSFLWDKAQFLFNIKEYAKALEIYNNLLISADRDKIYLLKNRLYYERAQVYNAIGSLNEAKSDMILAKKMNLDTTFENGIPEPTILFDSEVK